jgi:hypothetical protein
MKYEDCMRHISLFLCDQLCEDGLNIILAKSLPIIKKVITNNSDGSTKKDAFALRQAFHHSTPLGHHVQRLNSTSPTRVVLLSW